MPRHHALIAALLVAAPSTAGAQTLADALAACESFTANHAIPDTVDTEFTLFGDFDYATMDTEFGPVLLTFALDYGLNSTTYCDLIGADPRDTDGPIWVTWGQAMPLVKQFLAQREADSGGKVLPSLTGQLMFAACRDDGGYFITAQEGLLDDRVAGLQPEAHPLLVRINEWSGNAAKPCDF